MTKKETNNRTKYDNMLELLEGEAKEFREHIGHCWLECTSKEKNPLAEFIPLGYQVIKFTLAMKQTFGHSEFGIRVTTGAVASVILENLTDKQREELRADKLNNKKR